MLFEHIETTNRDSKLYKFFCWLFNKEAKNGQDNKHTHICTKVKTHKHNTNTKIKAFFIAALRGLSSNLELREKKQENKDTTCEVYNIILVS